MTILNNLYPPIIDTYMPAFINTSACRVYFSLSSFNSEEDIKYVQVSLRKLTTNLSAWNKNLYSSEVKIYNLLKDITVTTDYCYYIDINPKDVSGGRFQENQFYKVQIRFVLNSEEVTSPPTLENGSYDGNNLASWLYQNQDYFSEWSSVCLIKGISQPKINLKGLTQNSLNEINIESLLLTGELYYDATSAIEKESLKRYRFTLFLHGTDTILEDSGYLFSDSFNPNEISYDLKYSFSAGQKYSLNLFYETINGYSQVITYGLDVKLDKEESFKSTLSAMVTSEETIQLSMSFDAGQNLKYSTLEILRASHEDNFLYWNVVHKVRFLDNLNNYIWTDLTPKSGVWYNYKIRLIDTSGKYTNSILLDAPILIFMNNSYLAQGGRQLKIEFNPQVSSFKYRVSDSLTETIGGTYPITRRNGNIKYRQFSISGLISSNSDENNLFLNKNDVYKSAVSLYENFNTQNNITKYNDYIYEKVFRDEVMNFLYNNTIKLFKSTTEGNILVKLTDITFSPVQSLGRMLYSFSATATEIDSYSIENCEKYNIQTINEEYITSFAIDVESYNNQTNEIIIDVDGYETLEDSIILVLTEE